MAVAMREQLDETRGTPGERAAVLGRLRDAIARVQAAPRRSLFSLSTGLKELDALGAFRLGRAVELCGEEASGRASLALRLMASACREKRLVAWVDGPNELYPPAAEGLGVELARLLVVRPKAPKQLVWSAAQLLRSGAFTCVVLDVSHTGLSLTMLDAKKLVDAARAGGSLLVLLTTQSAPAQGLLRLELSTTVAAPGLRPVSPSAPVEVVTGEDRSPRAEAAGRESRGQPELATPFSPRRVEGGAAAAPPPRHLASATGPRGAAAARDAALALSPGSRPGGVGSDGVSSLMTKVSSRMTHPEDPAAPAGARTEFLEHESTGAAAVLSGARPSLPGVLGRGADVPGAEGSSEATAPGRSPRAPRLSLSRASVEGPHCPPASEGAAVEGAVSEQRSEAPSRDRPDPSSPSDAPRSLALLDAGAAAPAAGEAEVFSGLRVTHGATAPPLRVVRARLVARSAGRRTARCEAPGLTVPQVAQAPALQRQRSNLERDGYGMRGSRPGRDVAMRLEGGGAPAVHPETSGRLGVAPGEMKRQQGSVHPETACSLGAAPGAMKRLAGSVHPERRPKAEVEGPSLLQPWTVAAGGAAVSAPRNEAPRGNSGQAPSRGPSPVSPPAQSPTLLKLRRFG